MKKILIVYDSEYGATDSVARHLKSELIKKKFDVDLDSVECHSFDVYDAIIVGSPIHVGQCSKKMTKFLKDNYNLFSKKTVAFFFTCMSVTEHQNNGNIPVFMDPGFNLSDEKSKKLNFMEKKHTASFYFDNLKSIIDGQFPVALAFFKGNLDLSRLGFKHWLIMKLAMFFMPDLKEGDFINMESIHKWSDDLANVFKG